MPDKVEILAPAGSMTVLKAAVNAGADAIYLAGKSFGARAYAKNFDEDELLTAISYAHSYGVRIYLTLNTLIMNEEMDSVYPFLLPFYKAGLDGVIVQDMGIVGFLKENFPLLPIHASTQMSICSKYAAAGLKELGISRIVPARELTIGEIKKIKDSVDIEIESFVHGAMCFCYSGRCLFSSFNGGRSGNRGRCAQPCRMEFKNGHVLSMKDMCTVEQIPLLLDAGIDSFKIEGRMKNEYYTAMAVEAYKELSLDYYKGCFSYDKAERYNNKLRETFSRGNFFGGYYKGFNRHEMLETKNPGRSGVKIGEISDIKKGTISFKALTDIHKKDLLSVYAGKEEVSLTSDKDCKKGAYITLNAPNTRLIKKNSTVYRTRSEALKNYLDTQVIGKQLKRPVKAYISLIKGEQALLRMRLSSEGIRTENENAEVKVFGDVVSKAEKSPVTKEILFDKLKKLGDTPFYLSELEAEIEDDVFINITSVNEMRRSAAALLEEKLINSYVRTVHDDLAHKNDKSYAAALSDVTEVYDASDGALSVLISRKPQLDAFYKSEQSVNRAYIDISLFESCPSYIDRPEAERLGDIYIALPHIYRDNDIYNSHYENVIRAASEGKIKGVFVRNPDDLFKVLSDKKLKNLRIAGASSLYVFNDEAYKLYKTISEDIKCSYSEEQSKNTLIKMPPLELKAYGYTEYMITAQDVISDDIKGNGKRSGDNMIIRSLKSNDRSYPVIKYSDRDYDVILSDRPLSLHEYINEFKNIRLEFTIEDFESTLKVLETFRDNKAAAYPFTTGHIERSIL